MIGETEKIDLNLADVEQLSTLPGIGKALAERIAAYRRDVHPFEEVIEVAAVPGISERMVRKFEDLVTAAPPTLASSTAAGLTAALEEAAAEPQVDEEAPAEFADAEPVVEAAEEVVEAVPEEDSETTAAEEEAEAPVEIEEEAEEVEEPVPADIVEEPITFAGPPPSRPVAAELDGAPPPEPAVDQDKQARRRGCLATFLGGLMGTFLGTVLTLAIIASLNNGKLSFTDEDIRLERDMATANQVQADLNTRLETLNGQLEELSTRLDDMEVQQADTEAALSGVQQNISGIQSDVAAVSTKTEELDERLSDVAAAADTFNTFLDRLRDLLLELQGTPPAPEPTAEPAEEVTTPEASPPAEAGTPAPSATEESGVATRTPRPTATPFTLPTSTPQPQP